MHAKPSICIIDDHDRRRTVLEEKLGNAFTVIAMRTPGVLVAAWPEADVFLVAAEYSNVDDVRRITEQNQVDLAIIAFGEMLDADQVIAAIYAGAIDCIDLSRHWSGLPQRVELAMSRHSPRCEAQLQAAPSASEAAGEAAEQDRHILGVFAAGKAEHRLARARISGERTPKREVKQIRKQLRPPSFKKALRTLTGYFR